MECREVRQLADAFISEQLLVETTQAIVAHLERCPECRSEIEGLRRLRASTRAAFESAPDLRPRAEFLAALDAQLRVAAIRQTPPAAFSRWWMAVAASLLLLAGVGFGVRAWSTSGLVALLRTAVGDHRFCALDFKLAEGPIPLEEAARRYGMVYRAFERIEPSSTVLAGGPPVVVLDRHSCVFDGRRFVHIVMRYKDDTVSLLVAADDRSGVGRWNAGPAADGTTLPVRHIDAFQVTAFRGTGHLAYVVSSLGDDDVQDIARAMVGPVSRALAGALGNIGD